MLIGFHCVTPLLWCWLLFSCSLSDFDNMDFTTIELQKLRVLLQLATIIATNFYWICWKNAMVDWTINSFYQVMKVLVVAFKETSIQNNLCEGIPTTIFCLPSFNCFENRRRRAYSFSGRLYKKKIE